MWEKRFEGTEGGEQITTESETIEIREASGSAANPNQRKRPEEKR